MRVRGLDYDNIWLGSVTNIPAPKDTFDLVFSHGVLHHVPDIGAAEREIHRTLKPDGRLVVMLYARHSLNYEVAIRVVRRLALLGAWPVRDRVKSRMLAAHLANAEREGLWSYLRIDRFLTASTDGPDNPFSKVYDIADVRHDFPSFRIVNSHKHFMHAPPLPVHALPGGSRLGWHLWVEMTPR
jgi:SAM-dependent methyltransferase